MRALRRFLCRLHGHDLIRHYEPNRITLRCASCPYETTGWTIKDRPKVVTHPRSLQFIAQCAKDAAA
jgi:hypothetical protein